MAKEIIDVNADELREVISPTEYFNQVKDRIKDITDEDVKAMYDNALQLLKRFIITGQSKAAKKVVLYLDAYDTEMKIVKAGFNKYILRKDIEEYIKNVDTRVVKLIELCNFERTIPDDVVDTIANIPEGLFSNYYVIFTDYTGKEEKKVKASKRDKDPILVGGILIDGYIADRLYYIASWTDEYCDLTLDKLIDEYKKIDKNNEIVHDLIKELPDDLESLKKKVDMMK